MEPWRRVVRSTSHSGVEDCRSRNTKPLFTASLAFHNVKLYLAILHGFFCLDFGNWDDNRIHNSMVLDQSVEKNGHVDQGVMGYLVIAVRQFQEWVLVQPLKIGNLQIWLITAAIRSQRVEIETVCSLPWFQAAVCGFVWVL